MSARALGTVQAGDVFTVTVRHGSRDSYSRAHVPAARRNLRRLYPFDTFELVRGLIDDARTLGPDEYETDWVFRRTTRKQSAATA